jgi:hypothetical protein
MAIMGERELAFFGLMDYPLQRLGTWADEARSVVQGMRLSGDVGVDERRLDRSAGGAVAPGPISQTGACANLCLQRNAGAMGCALNMQLHRASRSRGIS